MTDAPWDRPPPFDAAAEAAVLGAALLGAPLDDATDLLGAQDFYVPRHQFIWTAVAGLHAQGDPVDPITVLAALKTAAKAVQMPLPDDTAPYLHTLVRDVPTASSLMHYARLVATAATQRRLLVAGQRIVSMAEAGVDDLGERAVHEVHQASRQGLTSEARTVGDLVDDAIDRLDQAAPAEGVPTGYRDLDRGHGIGVLLPLRPGRVTVIGGRTSIGKSVAARDIARHVAVHLRERALLLSLEMDQDEVMHWLIAAQARVSSNTMEAKDMSETDWANVVKAREALIDAPLFLDCNGKQTLASITRAVRAIRPKLLLIDYFQLVTTDPTKPRREGLEELSRGIKLLAKAEQVAVVFLSQINRAPTARQDKRPLLSDLRETGAIEQDADTVILLHRPDADDPLDRAGEIDLIVAKQRGGPTGIAHLSTQLHYGRFVDSARGLL